AFELARQRVGVVAQVAGGALLALRRSLHPVAQPARLGAAVGAAAVTGGRVTVFAVLLRPVDQHVAAHDLPARLARRVAHVPGLGLAARATAIAVSGIAVVAVFIHTSREPAVATHWIRGAERLDRERE